MRHILSIAIILCLLILVAVYFLSDPDPEHGAGTDPVPGFRAGSGR